VARDDAGPDANPGDDGFAAAAAAPEDLSMANSDDDDVENVPVAGPPENDNDEESGRVTRGTVVAHAIAQEDDDVSMPILDIVEDVPYADAALAKPGYKDQVHEGAKPNLPEAVGVPEAEANRVDL
jgi:hypothetical protein